MGQAAAEPGGSSWLGPPPSGGCCFRDVREAGPTRPPAAEASALPQLLSSFGGCLSKSENVPVSLPGWGLRAILHIPGPLRARSPPGWSLIPGPNPSAVFLR